MSAWEPPSPQVAELIRTAARMQAETPEIFAAVDAATFADLDPTIAADPALVAAMRRANHANLRHWAEHNIAAPGAPVPPNLSPEVLGIARDFVRRGLEPQSLDAYRTGQNAAWRLWMGQAFTLTDDTAVLGELLDVSARSIFGFVDGTIASITARMEQERERLTRGTHAERLEVVTLILEGAPITRERAEARLQYALDRPHTAAVVFSDVAQPDPAVLEGLAEELARAAGARRPFTVVASAGSLWVWVAGDPTPGLDALRTVLDAAPEARLALGPTAHGVAGFRRSHLDALATQRLLHRTPDAVRFATYDEVRVVALATQDEERANEFVERTLGPLATGAPELRETLRTYLGAGSNASRTAELTYAHRNTVLNRLARAQELLPAPLEGRVLPVALALEVVRWLGPRS